MDRLACLELPAFPLQLVLRAHADWRGEPAAVVERDAPHGLLLWVNQSARAAGVLPGQRYAAALGHCARLRAGVISPAEIERGVAELLAELQRFSPEVEACAEEPGLFWLGVRGLERLFGAPREWAGAVLARVRELGHEARIAVGFRHFAVYAGVKALGRVPLALFEDREHETRVAAGVSLAHLSIDPDARDALAKLAITTLGAFARLPAGGILQRFGASVHRLHRMASGAFDEELAPADELVPLTAHVDLELPEGSIDSILFHAEELARPLCAALERRGEGTSAVALRLDLDDGSTCEESVVPASATSDVAWLMRLLRMRLEARFSHQVWERDVADGCQGSDLRLRAPEATSLQVAEDSQGAKRCMGGQLRRRSPEAGERSGLRGRTLARGAMHIAVTLARAPIPLEQATLFREAKRRSARDAAKAFSALRAAFGEGVVVRARPATAHLPEYSFTWERCDEPAPAAPEPVLAPPLVRCLFETPLPLPPRGRHEPDGWLLRGVTHGSVARLCGPYRLSGGWWRTEVKRDYHFAELTSGEVAWIYYDVARRRWFLQGFVT